MKWLLDTNVCIRYLNGRSPLLRRRLQTVNPADLLVCSIVKAELYFGSARSSDPVKAAFYQRQFLDQFASIPFDDRCAELYGSVRATLTAVGTPIGPNDLLIAAIALANDLILVTHNTSEFGRVPGLKFEDWEV